MVIVENIGYMNRGGRGGHGPSSLGRAGGCRCQRLEKRYQPRMASLNSPIEWCLVALVKLVGVDVVPFE